MNYIPLDDCVDGMLYRLSSRNLTVGVFHKETKGFIGIREKFGDLYLFTEFHWDTGPPFGTVLPKEAIGPCPIKLLDENNKELFDWFQKHENS